MFRGSQSEDKELYSKLQLRNCTWTNKQTPSPLEGLIIGMNWPTLHLEDFKV